MGSRYQRDFPFVQIIPLQLLNFVILMRLLVRRSIQLPSSTDTIPRIFDRSEEMKLFCTRDPRYLVWGRGQTCDRLSFLTSPRHRLKGSVVNEVLLQKLTLLPISDIIALTIWPWPWQSRNCTFIFVRRTQLGRIFSSSSLCSKVLSRLTTTTLEAKSHPRRRSSSRNVVSHSHHSGHYIVMWMSATFHG